MNNAPSQRTRILIWLTAIAFVIMLQFWWIPGQTYRASDSYSTMSDGKLGLFRVLSKLFPDVSREANTLVPSGNQTMILVDPPADVDGNAARELNRFVTQGGVLVFAPSIQTKRESYNELGFDLQTLSGETSRNRRRSDKQSDAPKSESKDGPATDEPPENFELFRELRPAINVTGPVIDGTRMWETDRQIKPGTYFRHTDLLTDASGRIHATAINVGRGTIVVCTSPEAFSNRAMLDPDRAELAVRLIEYADQLNRETNRTATGIVISERLNDTRTGDIWGILLGPALRHGSLQIVLIGILIAWLGYEQFGPHRKRSRTGRKSLTDAAEALGNLQFRSKNGAQVLARYYDYVMMHARRGSGQMTNLQSSEWLAGRTGLPIDEVKSYMTRIETILKTGQETPANVASMIRWLANIQQRLIHPHARRKT